ncbi:FtsX-like permease family protein [Pelagicoccus sp. SDUM812003]|uniref:ABC transporter permease n=1 Tax=Pelagicoccus sp. SDUM812003 TaxID=3041267 RepID=UPI00280CF7B0|nr:FtsX-like permease family protein [Pelagicoccus sp. SDUM812003]MDQ8203144.1 FtsX-like permease family protein [Pelagicoccus sp. SDUM812003]
MKKADFGWILTMAWRDMRRAKRKLGLFALAVVAGVAALVAINSFRDNLEDEMDSQSRSLLGADVEYDSDQPFSEQAEALFREVPSEDSAREIKFATMAYFPKQDDTRIVRAHAMEGAFPWYGEMDTRPAGLTVADREDAVALLEDSLMLQFDLEVGDPIKIGDVTFEIIGEILRVPGEGSFTGSFAPRVLIPMSQFQKTGLNQFGSRLDFYLYQKFDDERLEESLLALEGVREQLEEMDVDVDTVDDQRRRIGRTLESMNSFLSMVGFVALLLGGVAIGGAVQVYLKAKTDSVATLRCLGASSSQAMWIFCIQISLIGLLGCLMGAALGVSIQSVIPKLMESFLPLKFEPSLSWGSIGSSLLFGWLFTSLFAFLPLLPLCHVSPLRAIRASVESGTNSWKDMAFIATLSGLLALSAIFTITQTRSLAQAAGFFGGILVALLLLAGVGRLMRMGLKRVSGKGLPYVWRQGLSNLHRPNNRTTMLVVTLGMGAFLIYTIYVSEQSMLRQGDLADEDGQPNVILFDIQPDQLEGVKEEIEKLGVDQMRPEPIVTMRLQSLNGLTPEELDSDQFREVEGWAVYREYRSTYRDYLREDEELVEGTFTAEASLGDEAPIPISVEERIVEALKLEIGDEIVWDVQGLPVSTRVASIRKVDWRQMKPNFFVVFPAGVLEAAPAFYVTAAHAPDKESLVTLQSNVVKRYANVSAVNLSMLLESLQEIFDKISFVIRFMASFTIVTGLVALAASVMTSRYQRSKESALLRTIGASAKQIRGIMSVEFVLVGLIAGLAGVTLSLIAAWALTEFVFEVELYIPWGVTLATVFAVALLTLLTGLANSLGIASKSPMESIRNEGG